ncbi:MAG: hypothetical protein M4579_002233 [Chaenotheca gracillima]|nr:MAG: hypothetical protein M4579_002233 [Chaenotheca gracillima]
MSNELAVLEGEIKEYKLQLETVQAGINADPDNVELQNLKVELEEVISLTETAIAELRPASASRTSYNKQRETSPPPTKEKWSKENHPAYQAGYKKSSDTPREEPPPTPVTFSVNDSVLAKWRSGDNGFYPARITSITGSAHAPVYVVSFKSYATTETLQARDIKPLSNDPSKKRKADGSPSTASTPATPSSPSSSTANANSGVISAAANIDEALANQARREPSKATDGPIRPAKVPRKVKANKELEAGKNKWQEFAGKGKMGKTAKKDSMFRTPEGVHGRVGFTGSGQTMRKDQTRSRHIYQHGADEEQY